MKYTPIAKLPANTAYLHFEATRLSADEVQVDYELVIPLGEVDCRGTFDHKGNARRPKGHKMVWLDANNSKRIPLGRTNIGTGRSNYPFHVVECDEIDLPFRDGAHQSWDNEKLGGLPVIYTASGKYYQLLTKESTVK